MKAVEWVAKFDAVPANEAPPQERFAEVLKEFGVETAELVTTRTKNSLPETKFAAADGAVKEQKNKFRAICGRVPALTETLFDFLLATALPDFATWEAAAKKKAETTTNDGKDGRKFGGKHHHKKESGRVEQGRKN